MYTYIHIDIYIYTNIFIYIVLHLLYMSVCDVGLCETHVECPKLEGQNCMDICQLTSKGLGCRVFCA